MILSMIFWGASWINMKILTNYINEYEVIFFRLGISMIALIPILIYMKSSFRLNFKSLVVIVSSSLFLVLYSLAFFLGVKYGTAGLGGALVTTLIPINTFVILAFWHKKVISLKHSFALILGSFGVLTMLNIWIFDPNEIFSKQNIFYLLASIFWPLLTIANSKERNLKPIVLTFYIYLFTTITIYLFFIDDDIFIKVINYDWIFWINLGVISLLSTTFATTIYFIGIERLGTNKVSTFIFLVPTSALVLSSVFLGEHISFYTILGTICTITAIYILNDIKIKNLMTTT